MYSIVYRAVYSAVSSNEYETAPNLLLRSPFNMLFIYFILLHIYIR